MISYYCSVAMTYLCCTIFGTSLITSLQKLIWCCTQRWPKQHFNMAHGLLTLYVLQVPVHYLLPLFLVFLHCVDNYTHIWSQHSPVMLTCDQYRVNERAQHKIVLPSFTLALNDTLQQLKNSDRWLAKVAAVNFIQWIVF